jgi:hypothetical protein
MATFSGLYAENRNEGRGDASVFAAKALMAIAKISQAIMKAVRPIATLKINIASSW